VVFTKLAWERMVMDQMQKAVDNKARTSFQRDATSRRKEYKQEYWWERGELMPARPPNLGAAFGQ
jgi:hypothetical protein